MSCPECATAYDRGLENGRATGVTECRCDPPGSGEEFCTNDCYRRAYRVLEMRLATCAHQWIPVETLDMRSNWEADPGLRSSHQVTRVWCPNCGEVRSAPGWQMETQP